jgi:glucose/arabinose dehydrogenase
MKTILPALATLVSLAMPLSGVAQTNPGPALKTVSLAKGLNNPWALAFLPDGRMLVTEKAGRLRIVAADGKLGEPITGLPPISAGGQCGLLDVVLDPQFATNQRIWFTFAEPAAAGQSGNSTAVARARLVGNALQDVRTVFSQVPKVDSRHHCGSRIVFGRDGTLWVGLGDRFGRMADAQTLDNHMGKIVRIDPEGQAPADNPYRKTAGARPELWSIGHRNIQGMALNPATGELWSSEHGPQGGDEINIPRGGMNHGWPVVTTGRNYGLGTRIGDDGPKEGFVAPLRQWTGTSIAPSGMVFLTSDRYPGWKGDLFIGALRGQALVRLDVDGNTITGEQRLLDGAHRIRDVRQGPDGWLYVLTDGNDGEILRVETR